MRPPIEFIAFTNLKAIEAGLGAMLLAGYKLGPVFAASRKAFRADQREHQRARKNWSGASWAALAASTIERRRQRKGKQGVRKRKGRAKPGARVFRQLGRLPGSYRITFTDRALTAANRVPWSAVHFHGGRAGHGSHIPSREFMGVSGALLTIVANKAVAYMLEQWEHAA